MEGFASTNDPLMGQPLFQRSATHETADDPDDIYWDNSLSPSLPGVDGSVQALTVFDGKLIAGGGFTIAGGVTVNFIAAWDGSSWSALGSGMKG